MRAPGGPPQPVSAALDAEAARHLPGTGGDPALAAQDLPGVARAAPGATGLVVWGAAPAESRVLFDGVEIPALTHFGGFRSTVGAELVGRIDVVPGAYGAEYGRALGGLVRIEPRPLETSGAHLVLDANLLDGGASLRGGVGRLRLAAAARTSYLDRTYGRALPASTLDSTSAQSLFPIPRYSDAQIEAALPVGERATLRAFALASFDRVRRELGGDTAGLPARTDDQHADWWRAAVTYEERGDDDGLGATLYAGGDHTSDQQQFGAVPASQSVASREVGLRARYRARLAPAWRLTVGLDGWLQSSDVRPRRQPHHPGARGRPLGLRPAARRRRQRRPLVGHRRRRRALRQRDVHARPLDRDAERARRRLPGRRQPRAAADRRHAGRRLLAPRLRLSIRGCRWRTRSRPR